MTDKPENTQNPGKSLIANRFRIIDLESDLIGRGGMGDVYRGIDAQNGDVVAVKMLKPELVRNNPEIVARFVREGKALTELNHPNIVKILAAVEEDDQHYLVMEFVQGGSLQQLLKTEGPLAIKQTVEIALDLADALTRAHRLNIIHRDLKPANVLLAKDGTPRLTDFGIAQREDELVTTQTGVLIGTPQYLSPEAFNGERLNSRTDIWAFGVLIYEMLTGQEPFKGDNLAALMNSIISQPVPDLFQIRSDIPDALADLIYRMLEKVAGQRIPSVRFVGAELETILEDGLKSSLHSPSQTEIGEQVRRFISLGSKTSEGPNHNLPAQTVPMVNRTTERAELTALLKNPNIRLVTILGSGGMGKSRLALEVAITQLEKFVDGVYLVYLAPINSIEEIIPTTAEAIGFSFYEGATPKQQLLDYLRQKTLLLILDNFEHLLNGAEIVSDILQTAPNVKVLATSRERLNLHDEQLFHIVGVDFPHQEITHDEDQSSAMELFLQSANRIKPGFELSTEDFQAVAQLCRLVQGMPLGILLAAAWVTVLTPAEIVAEISQSPDFLETDLRDIPERHRSIRAVFNYSWKLLTEQEREVFQQLAVFRGGFLRQAAQAVTGSSLRTLMALVNKSLLNRAPTGRYEIHELVRQYAQERLSEDAHKYNLVREKHCDYFVNFLNQCETKLKDSRQLEALQDISIEIKSIQIAWHWAAANKRFEKLDHSIDSLGLFYEWKGRFQEGEADFRQAAESLSSSVSGDDIQLHAKVLAWQGLFLRKLGQINMAEEVLIRSMDMIDSSELANRDTLSERAFISTQIGHLVRSTDRIEAKQLHENSNSLYQRLGDRWGEANALADLSWISWSLSDYDQARKLCENSLAIRRELGDIRGIAQSLSSLGFMEIEMGRLSDGEHLVEESVELRHKIGDRANIARGLRNLGSSVLFNGKYEKGILLLEESVEIYEDLGIRSGLIFARTWLALANVLSGEYEAAFIHGQLGLKLAEEINHKAGIAHAHSALGLVALVRKDFSEACRLYKENVAFYERLGQRFELALASSLIGYAFHGLGESELSQQHLFKALQTTIEIRASMPLLYSLPAIALQLANNNQEQRAIEIYVLASQHPHIANSYWFDDVFGDKINKISEAMPEQTLKLAQERGKSLDRWKLANELLEELNIE